MPIHHLDHDAKVLHHVCRAGCQRAIPFARLIRNDLADGTLSSVSLPECPQCRTTESFHAAIPGHEVGEGTHEGSLVGTRYADTGGVVHEHLAGYSLDPTIVAQRRLVRALVAACITAPQ